MFAPTTITGAAIAGLTSPTYTVSADTAPSFNSKQFFVSALGGTQTNVDGHSVSKPFTITAFRPAVLKPLASPNPLTGVVANVPMNTYKVITRKGVVPYANQATRVARITTTIDIPAGSDSFEPEDLKAMLSAHFGVLYGQASGISDTILTGAL